MSNVKRILIIGELPFDLGNDTETEQILGKLHKPSLGVHFTWEGGSRTIDNEHGGLTAFYEYSIQGEEAFSYAFLEGVVKIFNQHGPVHRLSIQDIEDRNCPVEHYPEWINNEWANRYPKEREKYFAEAI